MSLMERPQRKKQSSKPIVFSFGQQNNSGKILLQDDYVIGHHCSTKHQFIRNLIEKYELKPLKVGKQVNESESKVKAQSLCKKMDFFQMPPLHHNYEHQEIKKQEDDSKNSEIFGNLSSSKSKIKMELEKSHNELLEKFKSPLQISDQSHWEIQEKEGQTKSDRFADQSRNKNEEKSAISTQNSNSSGSIPFIESVLMSKQKLESSQKKMQEIKGSPIQELSEFRISDLEGEEKIKRQNLEEMKVSTNIENDDNGSKMTIFWVTFIFVLVFMFCFPNSQSMNDF